jgi:hypothetical protein
LPAVVEESPELTYFDFARSASLKCIVGDKKKDKRSFYNGGLGLLGGGNGGGGTVCLPASYIVEYATAGPIQSGTIPSGGSETIVVPDPIVCADGTVENSNATYTDTVPSGGTLVLPDTDVNVNGNLEGSVVSVETIDIDVTDGVAPVTPTAINITGNTVTIEVPSGGGAPVGATLMKTGQTTSYRTGDDADTRSEGRATDFFTLASNNPFGNTNRFTDELGGSTYTNNIVIDWSTYNGATVLGYYRISIGTYTWDNAVDNSLIHTIGSFVSGWRLPNIGEWVSITNYGLASVTNYAPLNINVSSWLSTSFTPSPTNKWFSGTNGGHSVGGLTGTRAAFPVRTFTVTGTTLT